jgi:hypothetical protein
MNLAAENFSLHDIFIYGFTLKSKPPCGMELAAKKIYTENSCLTRAVGKNLTVSSVNFTRRQPLLRVAKPRAEHPGTGLFRGNNENKLGGGGDVRLVKSKYSSSMTTRAIVVPGWRFLSCRNSSGHL